jgi:hypothetical protein
MLPLILSLSILLLLPGEALAWGAGVHITIGSRILASLGSLPPQVASLLVAYPDDFLYGCIGADIIVGKKFTHYLEHCHSWRIGRKILAAARSDYQRACAYGYLAHLAMDTVAHNYFVPYKMVRTFNTALLKHAYWELRVEAHVDPKVWKTAQRVARNNFHSNDLLLREVLSDTIFSFNTNKRLFNSLLLLNRLRNWQRLLRTLAKRSKWELGEEDLAEYLQLAFDAALSILAELEASPYWQADPTGERALHVAKVMRKNLNLLWLDGKLPARQAEALLQETRQLLRAGITDPDRLLELLAAS